MTELIFTHEMMIQEKRKFLTVGKSTQDWDKMTNVTYDFFHTFGYKENLMRNVLIKTYKIQFVISSWCQNVSIFEEIN